MLDIVILSLGLWMPSISGEVNPSVTQANVQQTICVPRWSSTVRPPSSYTNRLKARQLADPKYADKNLAHYEEDHLISLELGGHPTSPGNLWPQPYAGKCGARVKDRLEDKLHKMVCSGELGLKAAQTMISLDWVLTYQRYIGPLECE